MRIFSTRFQANKILPVLLAIVVLAGAACSPGNRNLQDIHERIQRLLPGYNPQPAGESAPDPREVYATMGEAINDFDFEEALRQLDILKSIPGFDPMYATYSEAYLDFRLGYYDDALALANALDPGIYNHQYLELRCSIYNSMGDLDNALRDLDTIMLSEREDETSRRDALWDLLIRTGQWEQASNLEEKIDGDPSPQYNDLYNMLERATLNRDFATAEQIIERMPALPNMVQSEYTDFYAPITHIMQSKMYFEEGDVDRALENFRELGSEYEHLTTGWTILADYAIRAGRYDESRAAAIEGIIRSGGREVLDSLGIEYDEPGPDAVVNSPIRLDDVGFLLTVLGRISLADGDAEKAIEYGLKALEINKYQGFTYNELSTAYEFSGDLEKAIEFTKRGIELFPYDRELMFRYVRLAKMAPDLIDPSYPVPEEIYNELLDWSERYHAYFPSNSKSAFTLAGVLEFSNAEDAEARRLELMAQAYSELPQIPGGAIYYACLLAANGQCDEARVIIDSTDVPVDAAWALEFTSPDILQRADENCGFSDLITNAMENGN